MTVIAGRAVGYHRPRHMTDKSMRSVQAAGYEGGPALLAAPVRR